MRGCSLSTQIQNSLSVCDTNFSLREESNVALMNWSSSAELKSAGAAALKGSFNQSYWALLGSIFGRNLQVRICACLTETWQQPYDFSQLYKSTPPGFVYTCQPCGSSRGGGLAIIHRKKWKVLRASAPTFNSFESTVCQLSGPVSTIIATVYHPLKQIITSSITLLLYLPT